MAKRRLADKLRHVPKGADGNVLDLPDPRCPNGTPKRGVVVVDASGTIRGIADGKGNVLASGVMYGGPHASDLLGRDAYDDNEPSAS